jgi:hypothetical protein
VGILAYKLFVSSYDIPSQTMGFGAPLAQQFAAIAQVFAPSTAALPRFWWVPCTIGMVYVVFYHSLRLFSVRYCGVTIAGGDEEEEAGGDDDVLSVDDDGEARQGSEADGDSRAVGSEGDTAAAGILKQQQPPGVKRLTSAGDLFQEAPSSGRKKLQPAATPVGVVGGGRRRSNSHGDDADSLSDAAAATAAAAVASAGRSRSKSKDRVGSGGSGGGKQARAGGGPGEVVMASPPRGKKLNGNYDDDDGDVEDAAGAQASGGQHQQQHHRRRSSSSGGSSNRSSCLGRCAHKTLRLVKAHWFTALPVPFAFALGLFIPSAVALDFAFGTVVRLVWQRMSKETYDRNHQAVAAGLIAGEGVGGVTNAIVVFFSKIDPPVQIKW